MSKVTPEKLVFLFFLLFFIFVPNNDQGYDSYAFLLDARAGLEIVHPHHLLYNVLRYILFQLAVMLNLDALKVISLASSVFGAISLAVIFKILKEKTLPDIALTGTLLMGTVYSFWYYSTSVEVNIVSVMFLLLAIYYLLKEKSDENSILAFMFLTIGILFHQLLAIMLIPVFTYEAYRSKPFYKTVRLASLSLIPGFALYMIIAFAAAPDRTVSGIYRWLTTYGELGRWGIIGPGSVAASIGGIAKATYGGAMLRQAIYGESLSFIEILYLVGTAISAIGIIAIIVLSARNVRKGNYRKPVFMISSAVIFALFAFWWAPNDSGFWLYPVIIVLILAFRYTGYSNKERKTAYGAMILFALINIIFAISPSRETKRSISRQGASALYDLGLGSNDLVLTNLAQVPLALEYHYGVKVRTTSMAYQKDDSGPEAIARFQSMVEEYPGRVVVFENEISPESHRRFLFGRFSADDYRLAYSPFIPYLHTVDSLQVYGEWIAIYELIKNGNGP